MREPLGYAAIFEDLVKNGARLEGAW